MIEITYGLLQGVTDFSFGWAFLRSVSKLIPLRIVKLDDTMICGVIVTRGKHTKILALIMKHFQLTPETWVRKRTEIDDMRKGAPDKVAFDGETMI